MVEPSYISLASQNEKIAAARETLAHGGGGGTSGGMSSDASTEGLKPRVDFLQTAFLWLGGITIAAITTIVLVMVNLTASTNTRLDKNVEATSALNREAGQLSQQATETNRRLERIEMKLDAIAGRLPK